MNNKKLTNNKKLKIIPLGGLGEIGRNMTVFEYGDNRLIIDLGLRFPEDDMPGIDFIIPDIQYLKAHPKRLWGIIFTHGHYDHIGAIPYLIEELGYPALYARPLTRGIILKRQEEFKDVKPLDIQTIRFGQKISLGPFEVEAFHQNHNIPDSIGLSILTPAGRIIHTGDFKFDFEPVGDKPADLAPLARLGQQGVLLLMSDSTGAEKEGHAITEKQIQDNLETIFEEAPGRLIVSTFSSLLTRVQEVINLSEKYGRKVVVEGYSMKNNIQIARQLGYLKARQGTIISAKKAANLAPKQLTIICTGAQGEAEAALMRIVSGKHRYIKLQKMDSVIFSSSVIPGNERAVQGLKDDICRQGAKVYHNQMMDIHSGGHAQIEDLKMMISLLKPKFFLPIHGNFSMLVSHAEIAQKLGIKPENILIAQNGDILEIGQNSFIRKKEKASANYVMVDGLGIGDVGQIVLRDRKTMARDGMFVIVAVVDTKACKVKENIDIISRGFVYLKESKKLLHDTRALVKDLLEGELKPNMSLNAAYLKDILREKVGEFLFTQTRRRPMVLPVIIET